MTIFKKFTLLTAEQRMEYANLKDITELESLAREHGIELSEDEKVQVQEYFISGKLSLDDNDLDMVAGGNIKGDPEPRANQDGRYYCVPDHLFVCSSHLYRGVYDHIWAREKLIEKDSTIYKDCKCYFCGYTRESIS